MKKLIAILTAFSVLFLVLAIVSVGHSIDRAAEAIAAIGKVGFEEDSRERIDLALEYYGSVDTVLGLRGRVANADVLEASTNEYVRLAIRTATVTHDRRVAEGYTEEQVAAAVAAAREAVDTYCDGEACHELENYADLVALEVQYGTPLQQAIVANGSGTNEDAEEIELC